MTRMGDAPVPRADRGDAPVPEDVVVGPPLGSIDVAVRDGAVVLVLSGEIDFEVVSAFRRANVPDRDRVTAIDAGDVRLLSATAVQLLLDIRWAAALADRPLALVRTNPHVDRVLHLLGLTGAFPRASGPPRPGQGPG
jgi:anti-anti-sigma factor